MNNEQPTHYHFSTANESALLREKGLGDEGGCSAINAPGADLAVQKSTLFGAVHASSIEANASIFTDPVSIARQQIGCLRFCYVPIGSQTPPRYRCQPDLLLAQQVGSPPAAIIAIAIDPNTQQVYAGTSSGVWRLLEAGRWVPATTDPLNVTALLATFLADADSLPVTALLAGTADGKLLRATSTLKAGTGTISASDDERIVSSSDADLKLLDRALVVGDRTRFRQDVQIGDEILIADASGSILEIRTVIAIESDGVLRVDSAFERNHFQQAFRLRRSQWMPIQMQAKVNTRINALISYRDMGTGTITSAGENITGQKTQFTKEFAIGDWLAIATADAAGQRREITEITSDTQLKIHAAFETDLAEPTAFMLTGIVAATSGNGVIRSTNGGKSWSALNQGLTNLDVRSIVHHNRYLFAGTDGSGVFRSSDRGLTWAGGDPIDPEVRQTGLAAPNITSFAVNPLNNDIFVGTANGIFRSSDGGDRWICVSQELLNHITALISFTQAGTGSISSRNTRVTGQNTRFQTELQAGDMLILNGQTRTVTRIHSDLQQLTLNDAFDPDLPANTSFQRFTLLAGTANGTICRSTSNGKSWQSIANLTQTPIAALAIQPSEVTPTLFAGTQLGSLYRSQQIDRWSAMNTGIPHVEATLLLINQMQPHFTSERYGEPAYAQLNSICPIEIRTGAEDGSEMGVFHFLKQPQREANLQASLKEYLRFGLKADILYSSYLLNGGSGKSKAVQ